MIAAGNSEPLDSIILKANVRSEEITPVANVAKAAKESDDDQWNARFQQLFKMPESTPEEQDKKNKAMTMVADGFVSIAKACAVLIILERNLPPNLMTMKPCEIGGVAGGVKYKARGILFKLSNDPRIPPFKDQEGNVKKKYLYGIHEPNYELAAKAASLDLNAASTYNDLFTEIRKRHPEKNLSVHVPMQTIMEFMGYRLTAMPFLPIDKKTIIYGSCDGGQTVHNRKTGLSEALELAAQDLHLCGHEVCGSGKKLHAAGDVEGHQGFDNSFYLLDLARSFPPEDPVTMTHLEPIGEPRFYRVFRPEMLRIFRTEGLAALSPDALTRWGSTNKEESEKHNANVKFASQWMVDKHIPACASELDDAYKTGDNNTGAQSIEENGGIHKLSVFIHRMGLNLRHLGLLRNHCRVAKIKNQLLFRMVAASLTSLLRAQLRSVLSEDQAGNKRQSLILAQSRMRRKVAGFLNLVSGSGRGWANFWNNKDEAGGLQETMKRKFGEISMQNDDGEDSPEFRRKLSRVVMSSYGTKPLLEFVLAKCGIWLTPRCKDELDANDKKFFFSHVDIDQLTVRVRYVSILDYTKARGLALKAYRIQKKSRSVALRLLATASSRYDMTLVSSPLNNEAAIEGAICLSQFYEHSLEAAKADDVLYQIALSRAKLGGIGGRGKILKQLFHMWRKRRQVLPFYSHFAGASSWKCYKDVIEMIRDDDDGPDKVECEKVKEGEVSVNEDVQDMQNFRAQIITRAFSMFNWITHANIKPKKVQLSKDYLALKQVRCECKSKPGGINCSNCVCSSLGFKCTKKCSCTHSTAKHAQQKSPSHKPTTEQDCFRYSLEQMFAHTFTSKERGKELEQTMTKAEVILDIAAAFDKAVLFKDFGVVGLLGELIYCFSELKTFGEPHLCSAWLRLTFPGKKAGLKLLFNRNPNMMVSAGRTALIWSIMCHDLNLLNLLIQVPGINLEQVCERTLKTPVMHAAETGNQEIVKVLLSARARLTPTDKEGRSALTHAVIKNHFKIVDLLIAEGADPQVVDRLGWTLASYMPSACDPNIKRIVEKHVGPAINPYPPRERKARISDHAVVYCLVLFVYMVALLMLPISYAVIQQSLSATDANIRLLLNELEYSVLQAFNNQLNFAAQASTIVASQIGFVVNVSGCVSAQWTSLASAPGFFNFSGLTHQGRNNQFSRVLVDDSHQPLCCGRACATFENGDCSTSEGCTQLTEETQVACANVTLGNVKLGLGLDLEGNASNVSASSIPHHGWGPIYNAPPRDRIFGCAEYEGVQESPCTLGISYYNRAAESQVDLNFAYIDYLLAYVPTHTSLKFYIVTETGVVVGTNDRGSLLDDNTRLPSQLMRLVNLTKLKAGSDTLTIEHAFVGGDSAKVGAVMYWGNQTPVAAKLACVAVFPDEDVPIEDLLVLMLKGYAAPLWGLGLAFVIVAIIFRFFNSGWLVEILCCYKTTGRKRLMRSREFAALQSWLLVISFLVSMMQPNFNAQVEQALVRPYVQSAQRTGTAVALFFEQVQAVADYSSAQEWCFASKFGGHDALTAATVQYMDKIFDAFPQIVSMQFVRGGDEVRMSVKGNRGVDSRSALTTCRVTSDDGTTLCTATSVNATYKQPLVGVRSFWDEGTDDQFLYTSKEAQPRSSNGTKKTFFETRAVQVATTKAYLDGAFEAAVTLSTLVTHAATFPVLGLEDYLIEQSNTMDLAYIPKQQYTYPIMSSVINGRVVLLQTVSFRNSNAEIMFIFTGFKELNFTMLVSLVAGRTANTNSAATISFIMLLINLLISGTTFSHIVYESWKTRQYHFRKQLDDVFAQIEVGRPPYDLIVSAIKNDVQQAFSATWQKGLISEIPVDYESVRAFAASRALQHIRHGMKGYNVITLCKLEQSEYTFPAKIFLVLSNISYQIWMVFIVSAHVLLLTYRHSKLEVIGSNPLTVRHGQVKEGQSVTFMLGDCICIFFELLDVSMSLILNFYWGTLNFLQRPHGIQEDSIRLMIVVVLIIDVILVSQGVGTLEEKLPIKTVLVVMWFAEMRRGLLTIVWAVFTSLSPLFFFLLLQLILAACYGLGGKQLVGTPQDTTADDIIRLVLTLWGPLAVMKASSMPNYISFQVAKVCSVTVGFYSMAMLIRSFQVLAFQQLIRNQEQWTWLFRLTAYCAAFVAMDTQHVGSVSRKEVERLLSQTTNTKGDLFVDDKRAVTIEYNSLDIHDFVEQMEKHAFYRTTKKPRKKEEGAELFKVAVESQVMSMFMTFLTLVHLIIVLVFGFSTHKFQIWEVGLAMYLILALHVAMRIIAYGFGKLLFFHYEAKARLKLYKHSTSADNSDELNELQTALKKDNDTTYVNRFDFFLLLLVPLLYVVGEIRVSFDQAFLGSLREYLGGEAWTSLFPEQDFIINLTFLRIFFYFNDLIRHWSVTALHIWPRMIPWMVFIGIAANKWMTADSFLAYQFIPYSNVNNTNVLLLPPVSCRNCLVESSEVKDSLWTLLFQLVFVVGYFVMVCQVIAYTMTLSEAKKIGPDCSKLRKDTGISKRIRGL